MWRNGSICSYIEAAHRGDDRLMLRGQFGHQRAQIGHLGDLPDAIGFQLRAQHVQVADLGFGIEGDPEPLALDVRHQPAQFQQTQRFPDGAAAGAEALFQFLFP